MQLAHLTIVLCISAASAAVIKTRGAPELPEAKVPEVPKEVPKADIPEAKVPKAKVPKAEIPDAKVPKAEVPEAKVPKADVPEAEMPEVPKEVPKADVPEAKVPKAEIPDAKVPKAEVPEAKVPKADVPEAKVPEVPKEVPKADVPEAEVPEVPKEVPKADVPEAEVPEAELKCGPVPPYSEHEPFEPDVNDHESMCQACKIRACNANLPMPGDGGKACRCQYSVVGDTYTTDCKPPFADGVESVGDWQNCPGGVRDCKKLEGQCVSATFKMDSAAEPPKLPQSGAAVKSMMALAALTLFYLA